MLFTDNSWYFFKNEGVSKLSYSKKKSQSPDFHKPGLCYV